MYRIVITPPRVSKVPGDVRSRATQETGRPTSGSVRAQKAANAELQFDGPLSGLSLTGFTIFDNGSDGYRVSFPTRRFVASGGTTGSYLLLRATDPNNRTAYERLKREILESFHAFRNCQPTPATEAAS